MARQLVGRKRVLVDESTSSSKDEFFGGSDSSDDVFSVEGSENELQNRGESPSGEENEPSSSYKSSPAGISKDSRIQSDMEGGCGELHDGEESVESEGPTAEGNRSASSDDTVSLASVDSEAAVELVGRNARQKHAPGRSLGGVRGIFGHALLRGVPLPAPGAVDWDRSPALTSTRNTPRNVLDAIDRDLRFGRPAVTVEALAARHCCKKLVVARRIDSLRAARVHLAGVYFPSAARKVPAEAGDDTFLSQRDAIDRDIQTLRPAGTVEDLALKYGVPSASVQSRVQRLRDRHVPTRGIVSASAGETAFTAQEDAAIVARVRECGRRGVSVPWPELDQLQGRDLGGCSQRWWSVLAGWSGSWDRSCCEAGAVAEALERWRAYAAVCASRLTEAQRTNSGTGGGGDSSSGAGASGVEADVALVLDAVVEVALRGGIASNGATLENRSLVLQSGKFNKNFTAADDAAIIEACRNSGGGSGARKSAGFWRDLDSRLARPPGSCRSRWKRSLESRGRARASAGAEKGVQMAAYTGEGPVSSVEAGADALPCTNGAVQDSVATRNFVPEEARDGGETVRRDLEAGKHTLGAVLSRAHEQGAAQMARYTAIMDALWRRRVASGELTAAAALDAVKVVRLVLSSVVQVLVESRFLAATANPAPSAVQSAAPSVRPPPAAAPAPVSEQVLVPVPVPVQAAPSRAEQADDEGGPASRSRLSRFTAEEDALIMRRMAEFRRGAAIFSTDKSSTSRKFPPSPEIERFQNLQVFEDRHTYITEMEFVAPKMLGGKIVLENKVYYYTKRVDGEAVDMGEGQVYQWLQPYMLLKCASQTCKATAKAHIDEDGGYALLGVKTPHDEAVCKWDATAIMFAWYQDQIYDGLADGRFKNLNEAYAWAQDDYVQYVGHDLAVFPEKNHYRSNAKKILARRYPRLPTTVNLAMAVIPEHLTDTKDNDNQPLLLIQHSFQHPGERAQNPATTETIWVFASAWSFRMLCEASCVFGDGTFKTCPHPFYQLYMFHTAVGMKVRPMVYCLLTRKTTHTYNVLYDLLKAKAAERNHPIAWNMYRSDFESAMVTSVHANFAPMQVIGCYFHLCSAMYKKIVELGFTTHYRDRLSGVRTVAKCCMALAFLRDEEILPTFELIRAAYEALPVVLLPNGLPRSPVIETFFTYLRNQWLEGPRAVPRQQWSVYTLDGHRTNNDVEGYHSQLLVRFGQHSTLWRFVEKLVAEEWTMRVEVQQLHAGVPGRPKKSKQVTLDTRLAQLKTAYMTNQIDAHTYVKGISHLVPDGMIA